eukprot:GILJ01009040.1.p1 GENE.GILJ01009040.1~~GILJ01009040.1.p1  ORF type:complete len:266 (+),score=31.33 GILJ01009040.1:44-799(+)
MARKGGYAKLQGPSLEFYMKTLEVVLGRSTSTTESYCSLGPSKSISREHCKITYNMDSKKFELICLGKNGVTVDRVLYTRECAPVELKSQDPILIGDVKFYFLLPSAADSQRPTESYAELCVRALTSRPDRRMSLPQIYAFITDSYPYFSLPDKLKNWRKSVRAALANYTGFIQVSDASEKTPVWSVTDDFIKVVSSGRRKELNTYVKKHKSKSSTTPASPGAQVVIEPSPLARDEDGMSVDLPGNNDMGA